MRCRQGNAGQSVNISPTVAFADLRYSESSTDDEVFPLLPLSLTRIGATWLLMAIAMSVNGIARELLLKRAMSPQAADVSSALIGMTLIGGITYLGFRPLAASSPTAGQLVTLSITLVVATIVFESALGRFIDHKSWRLLLDHYAIWRGELWPVVLLWLACMPFLWARR